MTLLKRLALSLLLLALPAMVSAAPAAAVSGVKDAGNYEEFEEDVSYASGAPDADAQTDAIEGLNRAIYGFNVVVDKALVRPVSQVYKFVFPGVVRERVTLFFTNLNSPVVFLNSLLQGDPQNMFVTFWRFAINSTLGVAGLFDIATDLGIPDRRDEDFGQTLGSWGVGHGTYLMLPVIGPSSLRDTFGMVVDILTNPFTYVIDNEDGVAIAFVATQVVDTRTRYGSFIDNTYENSLDPYATFRSLYLQRRAAEQENRTLESEQLQPVPVGGGSL